MNDTEPCNGTSIRRFLKLSLLFTALITPVVIASANPLEKTNNSLNIESITSISNITDTHYYSLVKTAKIDALQVVFSGLWSPDGSRLLISSGSQLPGTAGLTAVYAMNADGTEIKEIASTLNNTRSKSLDMGLGSWSPDGNRIVIPTNIFRLRDFYVIADPDGTLFRVVGKNFTTIDSIRENILNIEWQRDFSWSPDGTKAFVVMGFNPMKQQLYMVDENGSILKQLTNGSIETMVSNPMRSRDGKKIVFSNFDNKNMWVMNEDGTELRRLLHEDVPIITIGWSSDDNKIFYQIDESIRMINVDGAGSLEIVSSKNRTMDDIFSLSPNGQKLLFTASTNEKVVSKLYVIDSDGVNQKLLLDNITSRNPISVGWSPKGDKIAFIEDDNLYTINPDGSGRAIIALTSFNYVWHPSGDYIAFSADIDKRTRKDIDHSMFWPKEESVTRPIFIARPDGTERVQITSNDQLHYLLDSWSPDGSRLLVDSFDNNSESDLLLIKFSGYDEVMSLYVPSSVQQDEEFTIQVKSLSKPIEKATITLNGREIGITNETGQLYYSFKEPGRYLLNATKEGYRVASKLVIVKENTQLQGQANITATALPTTDTPKTPGFSSVFSVIALTVIILLRRIR
ncbi:MAG: hypothetical protein OIN85_02645 [Candidatus Methanoperedens sp.]|nr:hypothetical protein [Candidatus Methanoperedens sp.]